MHLVRAADGAAAGIRRGAGIVNKPVCYDCLSGDVAVKVIDQFGFEHWFCAADWAAHQEFHARLNELLSSAAGALSCG